MVRLGGDERRGMAARRAKARPRRYFFRLAKGATVKPEHTVLSSVQEGDVWRVRIEWPNGAVHYFGSFASEKHALQWIGDHAWLTTPITRNTIQPPNADQAPANAAEQKTGTEQNTGVEQKTGDEKKTKSCGS